MKTDSLDFAVFADKVRAAGYQYGKDALENAFVGYRLRVREEAALQAARVVPAIPYTAPQCLYSQNNVDGFDTSE